MVFISYAQNYEDVMLARALGAVETGFYIDVGAQDPDEDSVTKHFYDRGWRGLNFEPSEHYHARLETARSRDVNLRCAVGDQPGSVTFYEADGTGLSTIVEAVSAATSEARIPHTVPMTTLDAACAAYGITTVHFLKIDVEGAEELVLRGTRFEAVRPWIVVIEATHPNSPEPYYVHWEPLLTERGYRFVYADGLNRFYLADEHAELAHHFAVPPNHFDRFMRASEVRADERAEKRWADNVAHHLKIIAEIDADRTSRQTALDGQAGRIEALTAQLAEKEEALAHHLGLIEEAADRARTQQAEIERLAGLVEAGALRERETIAHHQGLLKEATAQAERLQARVDELSEALGRSETWARILEGETAVRDGRIAMLEARVERQARQIAFRDDKIGWLSLDRDRFRTAHGILVESRLWRLTRPLQGATLRDAIRARPLVRALLPETEIAQAVVHASDTAVAPVLVAAAAAVSVPIPGEVPDRARWMQDYLFAA
ncbi:FkbM family methyltransferase [Methylobacterium sp. E-016]|uniref:FkbM family methyltransferase n=1 Tax=Methylobacterium sp. E-016 TaxID=2836556 RepID=UPI001FBB19D2|nr:FkbM family methyltransferase [Methylobacterium sp. E-016]MCJ2074286.1 FkbM family methyltransferase [Methylobacterium sp. E-016]